MTAALWFFAGFLSALACVVVLYCVLLDSPTPAVYEQGFTECE